MTTEAVVAGGIIGDTVIVDVVTAMDGVTTADPRATKSGALSAAFLCLP
jgi:hypothetical protein